MRVAVFDYGAGNLHSLTKALATGDAGVTVETDIAACLDADLLVLPGVGAFAQAAGRIAPARDAVRAGIAAGLPVLGICLGMQLLFDRSEEGPGEGLGVIAGDVTRLAARRVPQIGWNELTDTDDAVLEEAGLTVAYYANSFACRPTHAGVVSAWSRHENDRFPAMVRSNNIVGVQFHPEKSSAAGVRFLRALMQSLARREPAGRSA